MWYEGKKWWHRSGCTRVLVAEYIMLLYLIECCYYSSCGAEQNRAELVNKQSYPHSSKIEFLGLLFSFMWWQARQGSNWPDNVFMSEIFTICTLWHFSHTEAGPGAQGSLWPNVNVSMWTCRYLLGNPVITHQNILQMKLIKLIEAYHLCCWRD